MSKSIHLIPLTLILAFAGCDKKEETTAPESGEPSAKSVQPTSVAQPSVEKTAPEVAAGELTRAVQCAFVGWAGEGEERRANFTLTNVSTKPIKSVQTWIYYYKEGKQFDRYPHALGLKLEPGAKVEEKLGQKGKSLKEGIDGVGCEITEATFGSGEKWSNFNLNYNRLKIPRPLEGETHEQLRARTGVMVEAVLDAEQGSDGKATFTLTNKSKRPLEARSAWVYYYNASGKQLRFSPSSPRGAAPGYLTLEPGASESVELGMDRDKFPEGTAVIEAGVSEVRFLDGEKEKWLNRNLTPLTRKMVAPAKAPAPKDAP